MFEHPAPPRVTNSLDRHVVRNKILNQAHSMCVELGLQTRECLLAAEFGVELGEIANVVAVSTTWCGPKDWRTVNVLDSKSVKIKYNSTSVLKSERRIELNPVGRRWDPKHGFAGCNPGWLVLRWWRCLSRGFTCHGDSLLHSASARQPRSGGSAAASPIEESEFHRGLSCVATTAYEPQSLRSVQSSQASSDQSTS